VGAASGFASKRLDADTGSRQTVKQTPMARRSILRPPWTGQCVIAVQESNVSERYMDAIPIKAMLTKKQVGRQDLSTASLR
jgi:hypothetical protein